MASDWWNSGGGGGGGGGGKVATVTWAEGGASVAVHVEGGSHCFSAPACPPPAVVDTLGAGDCFNAAFIHNVMTMDAAAAADSQVRAVAIKAALHAACRTAGKKCGQVGFSGIQYHRGVISDVYCMLMRIDRCYYNS